MKSAGILQAVLLLLLLALAASCEVSKEYANRVFKPQTPVKKNDSTLAMRFMEFNSGSASDSIELAKVFSKEVTDSSMAMSDSVKTEMTSAKMPMTQSPVVIESKPPVVAESKKTPRDISSGTVRSKRVRQ